jgi:hypothetical protein
MKVSGVEMNLEDTARWSAVVYVCVFFLTFGLRKMFVISRVGEQLQASQKD